MRPDVQYHHRARLAPPRRDFASIRILMHKKLLLATMLFVLVGCARSPSPQLELDPAAESYDVLITGAEILDGTGAPAYAGDVAVRGGSIARVSRTPIPRSMAARVIDANGLVVSPGFIDLHA